MGYSEDTARVHWGTVRIQCGFSWGTVGYSKETVRVQSENDGLSCSGGWWWWWVVVSGGGRRRG